MDNTKTVKNKQENVSLFDTIINALANDKAKGWPLKTRDDVLGALDDLLKDSPPSPDILHTLIDNQVAIAQATGTAFPKGFVDELHTAIAYPFTIDSTIGMLPNEASDFFFDLCAHYKQQFPDRDTGVVEVDISNMGNANDALGRANVTTAVAVINRIYEMALANPSKAFGRDDPLQFLKDFTLHEMPHTGSEKATVIPVRKGGDELRYYVEGLDKHTIDERLKLAGSLVQAFTKELGTETLLHTKYDDAEHPREHYAGFGAGGASVMITGESMNPIKDIQVPLEAAITKDKLKFNKAKGLKRDDVMDAATIRARTDSDELTELLDGYRNQLDKSDRNAAPKRPRVLYYADDKGDAYAFNTKRAQEAFDHGYGDLFANVVEACVNLRDQVSGLRTSRASMEALEQLRNLPPKTGEYRPFTLEVELTNLNGLNNKTSTEYANNIIHEFADIVKSEVNTVLDEKEHANDAAFYSGKTPNKVRVLVKDANITKLAVALSRIDGKVREFNEHTIESNDPNVQYIGDIYYPKKLPNTDDPTLIHTPPNNKGVGISFVVLETDPNITAAQHVDISEKIMEHPIERGTPITFLTPYAENANALCSKGGSWPDTDVLEMDIQRGANIRIPELGGEPARIVDIKGNSVPTSTLQVEDHELVGLTVGEALTKSSEGRH